MINRAELRKKIDDWFDANSEDMIRDLGKLIEINSVRSKSEEGAPYGKQSREVLAMAQSMLEERGFDVSLFEDMVITANLGPNPPLMGILTHLDIVEAGEGWDSDPLKLTIKDDILYGRGVVDNKGPAVASMYAMYCVRDICPELNQGVQVILGSGEETGFDDITRYIKKNTPPPNVFSPDASFPIVNIEKGRFMPVFGAKWEKDTTLPRIVSITGGTTPNTVPNFAQAVVEGFSAEDAEAFCREYTKLA
jgi:succinyl-diaminopimelate desuccinylase